MLVNNKKSVVRPLIHEVVTYEAFLNYFLGWQNKLITNKYLQVKQRLDTYSEKKWENLSDKLSVYYSSGFLKKAWLRYTNKNFQDMPAKKAIYHARYSTFYLNYLLLNTPKFKLYPTYTNHMALYSAFNIAMSHIKPILDLNQSWFSEFVIRVKSLFGTNKTEEKLFAKKLKQINTLYKNYLSVLEKYDAEKDFPLYGDLLNLLSKKEDTSRKINLFLNSIPELSSQAAQNYFTRKLASLHLSWERKLARQESIIFSKIDPMKFKRFRNIKIAQEDSTIYIINMKQESDYSFNLVDTMIGSFSGNRNLFRGFTMPTKETDFLIKELECFTLDQLLDWYDDQQAIFKEISEDQKTIFASDSIYFFISNISAWLEQKDKQYAQLPSAEAVNFLSQCKTHIEHFIVSLALRMEHIPESSHLFSMSALSELSLSKRHPVSEIYSQALANYSQLLDRTKAASETDEIDSDEESVYKTPEETQEELNKKFSSTSMFFNDTLKKTKVLPQQAATSRPQ